MLFFFSNIRLFGPNLVFKTILILLYINKIKTDLKCGIPGNSLKSIVKPPLSNEKVTDNGVKVKYSCDYNDAPFLIGYNERECMDGEWSETIPKCATLFTGKYDLNSTHISNAINISLTNSARISGLVVRVSSYDPIDVVNIKNIPSPGCFKANTTVRDKIPFHTNRRRYTTLFHCPTKEVNFWKHSEVFWILITFSDQIRNCELDSCPAVLEFIELYETINDECDKPDVPAFGKLTALKRNNAINRYRYECENYFYMLYGKTSEVVCHSHEEWSPKILPKCVPNITCEVEPIDDLKVHYNWLWSDKEAVVGTVATFECIDNLSKINGSAKRECNSKGEWSQELPQCISIATTTVETTTTPLPTTPIIRYVTTPTSNPYPYSQQSHNIIYATNANPFIPPTDRYNPNPYPTQNINPYPAQYPPLSERQTTPYPVQHYPRPNEQTVNNSLNPIHFVYIFLGILLGILITIGVIYYFQKRRTHSLSTQPSERSTRNNRTPVRDEVYFLNNINDLNDSRISNSCLADQTVDTTQSYDSSGYIQIEAVEDIRMDSIRKYQNYELNNIRKQHKPLPKVPK